MFIKKIATPFITGLLFTTALSGCADAPDGQSNEKTTAVNTVQNSGAAYELQHPAAFSLNTDCSSTDVVINSYPNSYLMQGDTMCDIATGSDQNPIWTFNIGNACTLNGVISDTDADYKATLSHQAGGQYLLSQTNGVADQALTLCDANYQTAPVMWSTELEPTNRDDFDLEQSYNRFCEGIGCQGGGNLYQKYSDYSADVLKPLNLSTEIQSRHVKSHLSQAYAGRVTQSSFNNKNHATDHIQTFHLMPDGNPALHEYVLYVRMNDDGAFDNVKDWGGRVKCAPTRTDAPFQKTPCP